MMATGVFRRAGAAIVAASYLPKVMMARPSQTSQVLPFVREAALLGGAMVEAGNTQGKPTHAWLSAQRKKERAKASKAVKAACKNGDQVRHTDALREALSSATA